MAETSCNQLLFIDSATYLRMYIYPHQFSICTIKLLPCSHCCAQAISIRLCWQCPVRSPWCVCVCVSEILEVDELRDRGWIFKESYSTHLMRKGRGRGGEGVLGERRE